MKGFPLSYEKLKDRNIKLYLEKHRADICSREEEFSKYFRQTKKLCAVN